jgi:S1-C subfamily serine protease
MIGLNVAYISSRGIAIRTSKAKTISEQLSKDGEIKIAPLGIVTDEISLPFGHFLCVVLIVST